MVMSDDMRTERTICALSIPFETEFFQNIEHNGDWQTVLLTREGKQWLAVFRLDIGRIDDGEFACRESPRGDKMQHGKRIARGGLVVLVITNQAPTDIR